MRKSIAAGVSAIALSCLVPPAMAATTFSTTFDGLTPAGTWTTLYGPTDISDGSGGFWLTGSGGVEVQQNVAGASSTPAPSDVFVELDTGGNSAMWHAISAGKYKLSFLYSPRPGVGLGSNGIKVTVGNTVLFDLDAQGGAQTDWTLQEKTFDLTDDTLLTFAATGLSESLGGYIDNIVLSAVPEPGAWAMMVLGFAGIGGALRSRRRAILA